MSVFVRIRKREFSVTRLGDLLHFGQLFKASGSNDFAQIAHVLGNFCKGVKIFHFSSGIIFGPILQTFGNFLQVTLRGIDVFVTLFCLARLRFCRVKKYHQRQE